MVSLSVYKNASAAERTQAPDQVPLLHEERAVVPSLGDPLRAAQVEIDSITPVGDVLRGVQKVLLVVGAELDDERAVVRGDAFDRIGREVERFLSAFGLGRERGGVEHGRVAQVGAVYTREDPPGLG